MFDDIKMRSYCKQCKNFTMIHIPVPEKFTTDAPIDFNMYEHPWCYAWGSDFSVHNTTEPCPKFERK